MKKLLLIAAATAALSTSAFADATEGTFYGRVDLGLQKFTGFTDKVVSAKLKSKASVGLNVGVGYYLMDNVRAEFVYAKPFNVELKKGYSKAADAKGPAASGNVKHKADINALLVKAYVDVADLGMAKLFVGGGLGWSMIKEKITDNDTVGTTTTAYTASSKKKNDLAWTLGVGAGFDVADGVILDAQYAYSDFGKTKSAINGTGTSALDYGKNRYRAHEGRVGVRVGF